jgi:Tfp pilus assembly protein PilO
MKTAQSSQLLSILLLMLMMVGGVFFVLPMRDTIVELSTQRDTVTTEISVLRTEYDALAALAEEVSKSASTKEALMKAVPSGYGEDTLLLDVAAMAGDAGFKLNAINFSLGTDADLGNTITVTTNLTGDYDQLVEFLQKVESSERLMQVKSLNIQRTSATAVAFNVQIEAYYQ